MIKKSIEYISKIGRTSKTIDPNNINEIQAHVKTLKDRGYVVLDHLVRSKKFMSLTEEINNNIENKLNIKFPCLAQSKIDKETNKDLIDNNFLATDQVLTERGLTFDKRDFNNYQDMIKKFSPSTLTLKMQNNLLNTKNLSFDKTNR